MNRDGQKSVVSTLVKTAASIAQAVVSIKDEFLAKSKEVQININDPVMQQKLGQYKIMVMRDGANPDILYYFLEKDGHTVYDNDVLEFLKKYGTFLSPNTLMPITADEFMKKVDSTNRAGYQYIGEKEWEGITKNLVQVGQFVQNGSV